VRLRELLRLDGERGTEGRSPEALKSTLGSAAGDFVDPDALSRALPAERGPLRLEAARRARIVEALEVLSASAGDDPAGDVIVFHSGSLPAGELSPGWSAERSDDPIDAAIERFDVIAERAVALFRALRTAGLELGGNYEPELHDPLLEALRWTDLSEDELRSTPLIVAVETTDRLHATALGAFSELMRSGRPVQVLATENWPAPSGGEAAAGYHSALGYVAVAHREVFVLQSSLARPAQLVAGLADMARSVRPAAAVVALPPDDDSPAALDRLTAAVHGRATPCYRYDAARGTSWAERFDLDGNPAPDRRWPSVSAAYLDAEGVRGDRDEAFTYAHAAACDPGRHGDFLVLEPAAWDESQVELAPYLELPDTERAGKLPFIRVTDGKRRLGRAVLTRRLAFACRDRWGAWRVYQELAGTDNAYARRAAAEARDEAREQAELERHELENRLEQRVADVRSRTAVDTVQRLVSALMGEEMPAAAAVAVALDQEARPSGLKMFDEARTAGAEDQTAASVPPGPAKELVVTEPYIDSAMCTTCNDCTKINPRLFKYDQNDQAYIADVTAGTYEQLVRAAEKCPARCIHPGLPRKGDKSGTDAMIARGDPFNR